MICSPSQRTLESAWRNSHWPGCCAKPTWHLPLSVPQDRNRFWRTPLHLESAWTKACCRKLIQLWRVATNPELHYFNRWNTATTNHAAITTPATIVYSGETANCNQASI